MDKKIENAKKLPGAAKVLAVTSYPQFLDRYPIIKKIKPDDWDFFVTVAGIFVGLSLLNHTTLKEEEKDELREHISDEGTTIYSNWDNACDDCTMFVNRTYDGLSNSEEYKNNQQFLFSDSLGAWLVWNLFGNSPDSPEERQLNRALGAFIINAFFSWWK